MKKVDKIILERNKNYQKEINLFEKKINEYNNIAIFRHDHPDYDALGTQLALKHFLLDNFKNKNVIALGDNHITLTDRCFSKMDEVDDSWFNKPFLAIIVDCSTLEMVSDERFKKAKEIVKIDHHPNAQNYGTINIVDPSMSAAGELLANILVSLGSKYLIQKDCATNLYKAIVGDSGRFLYESTTIHTFKICEILLAKDINLSDTYSEMYNKPISDLNVQSFILKNYKITPHGVAYYVLDDKALKELNLPPQRGKENVNIFAQHDGIHAWMSCTEDKEKGIWKVSIRSEKESIQHIAAKYSGGGHDQASGCKLKSFEEFKQLVNDLDELFK